MQKIQKVSTGMVAVLSLALGLLALLAVTLAFFPNYWLQPYYSTYNLPPDLPLTGWQYGGLGLIGVINLVAMFYVLWKLRQMFACFAAGKVFSSVATRHLFRAARGLLIWAVIAVFSTTVTVLVLTANAATGQHVLAVDISSSDVAGIFAGVVLLVMSWVMQEAARLSAENAEFV